MPAANTASSHLALAKWLGDPGGIIIALETTGGYECAVWQMTIAQSA